MIRNGIPLSDRSESEKIISDPQHCSKMRGTSTPQRFAHVDEWLITSETWREGKPRSAGTEQWPSADWRGFPGLSPRTSCSQAAAVHSSLPHFIVDTLEGTLNFSCRPVLWIRYTLVCIRIRGSVPLTTRSGSGSCYFRYWPLAFFVPYLINCAF